MAAWPAAYLLEEGRLHSQVFGHHVQAEEMPVDPAPGHGQSVQVLVPLGGQLEETPALVVCLATQVACCCVFTDIPEFTQKKKGSEFPEWNQREGDTSFQYGVTWWQCCSVIGRTEAVTCDVCQIH